MKQKIHALMIATTLRTAGSFCEGQMPSFCFVSIFRGQVDTYRPYALNTQAAFARFVVSVVTFFRRNAIDVVELNVIIVLP